MITKKKLRLAFGLKKARTYNASRVMSSNRQIVKRLSCGNISLQKGKYHTSGDLAGKRERLLSRP